MTIVADKVPFFGDQVYSISKSGKDLGTRLTFAKIKKNPGRPTLLANPGSDDGKRIIFQVQPNFNFSFSNVLTDTAFIIKDYILIKRLLSVLKLLFTKT